MYKYKIFFAVYFLSIYFTNNVLGQFRPNNTPPPIERTTPLNTLQVAKTDSLPALRVLDTVVRKADTTSIVGYNAKKQNSLRPNHAFATGASESKTRKLQDRIELPYQPIREEDVLYSVFVWEEIDAREKLNRPFIYTAYDENGDQRFFAILLNALKELNEAGLPKVTPFSPDGGDDRFTKPMSMDEVNALMRGKLDTAEIDDGDGRSHKQEFYNTEKSVKPDSVYTFLLKEQFIFDKRTSRMYCRIIGIAPIATFTYKVKNLNTGIEENKTSKNILFWLYYPELRPVLSKYEVYNPKNVSTRITWEELLESRYFNGNIVKSSMDNINDKLLSELYKDPIKRLQEAEKIKQKIFDFEQDRWVY
jgi:gliding motility associated protien GldN